MCFDGNDFHDGQVFDELFRILLDEAAALRVPAGALQVEAVEKAALMSSLGDVVDRVPLRHLRVQRGLVERPAVLATRGLDQRGQVRLGYVQAGEPHDVRLAVVDPAVVLLIALEEVVHPVAQVLLGRWRQATPHGRQLAVEERASQVVQLVRHAHLSLESLFEKRQISGSYTSV